MGWHENELNDLVGYEEKSMHTNVITLLQRKLQL